MTRDRSSACSPVWSAGGSSGWVCCVPRGRCDRSAGACAAPLDLFVDLPSCRAVGATLCTGGGCHKPIRDFGGSPVKSGETVCTAPRSDAQAVHRLCITLCVRG